MLDPVRVTESSDGAPSGLLASGGGGGQRAGVMVRIAIALVGVIALAVGATAAFVLRSDTAAVVALIGGFALLITAVVLPRVSEIGVSTDGLTLKLTKDAAAAGAPKTASLLESTGLADYATAYGVVDAELRGDEQYYAARVHLQDSLVRRARAIAFANKIPAAEVRSLFLHGSPVLRTLSIGLMQGDPSTTDAALLASAISSSLSANEQYQALLLVRDRWAQWSREDRELLRHRIATTGFTQGSDRSALAGQILSLPDGPGPGGQP